MHTHIRIHIHTRIHIQAHTHANTRIHAHVTSTHSHIQTHIHTHIQLHKHTQIHTHIKTYTYPRIYTHTHAHSQNPARRQRCIFTPPSLLFPLFLLYFPHFHSNRPEGKGAYFGTFGKWQNMKASNSYDKRPLTKGEQPVALVCFLSVCGESQKRPIY